MERRRRTTSTKAVATIAIALGISVAVPAMASAQNAVDDLLKGVNGLIGGGAGGGGGGQVVPQAGTPPNYTPPLHGSNPHGQGSVATADLAPSDALPLPGDIDSTGEEVTVGDSRGEEVNGTYQGRVTLLDENILNIINIGIETTEGETETLAPLQPALDVICGVAMQGPGCATVLNMQSSSSATGSQNSFSAASTNLSIPLPPPLGPVGINTGIATTTGNISEDGTCQTADGSSNVASANLGIPGVVGNVTADALQGTSTSQACNNGSQSQSNSSTVLNLQGAGLGVPVAGCADGTPNSSFDLAGLVSTVCNADDSNNGQTSNPYGVREALTVFVLPVLGVPLLKVTTAGPESHAVAPAAATPPTTPPTTPPGGGNPGGGPGDGGPGNPGGPGGPSGGPTTTVAQAGGGELAFTGANLVWLGLIGGMLLVGGLGLARASTRRHSRAPA